LIPAVSLLDSRLATWEINVVGGEGFAKHGADDDFKSGASPVRFPPVKSRRKKRKRGITVNDCRAFSCPSWDRTRTLLIQSPSRNINHNSVAGFQRENRASVPYSLPQNCRFSGRNCLRNCHPRALFYFAARSVVPRPLSTTNRVGGIWTRDPLNPFASGDEQTTITSCL
jgi:hypothetical protein